eukprot:gene11012-3718_t
MIKAIWTVCCGHKTLSPMIELNSENSSNESSEDYFTVMTESESSEWLDEYKKLNFDEDMLNLFISKQYQRLKTSQVSQFLDILHFSFYKIKFFEMVVEKIEDKENLKQLVKHQILDRRDFENIISKIQLF